METSAKRKKAPAAMEIGRETRAELYRLQLELRLLEALLIQRAALAHEQHEHDQAEQRHARHARLRGQRHHRHER